MARMVHNVSARRNSTVSIALEDHAKSLPMSSPYCDQVDSFQNTFKEAAPHSLGFVSTGTIDGEWIISASKEYLEQYQILHSLPPGRADP
jgi:hypothetical protein